MLKINELVDIAPDAIALVDEIVADLRKDPDGKVRITKAEARRIRALVFTLAARFAKEAID